jgi:hypothetical protein
MATKVRVRTKSKKQLERQKKGVGILRGAHPSRVWVEASRLDGLLRNVGV